LAGCAPQTGDNPSGTWSKAQPKTIQDGIEIPLFTSPAAQLNHAMSGFRDKKEKSAALRAVITLFPDCLLERGHAALGLAYLHLEPDYRFARPLDVRKAANDFQAVLTDYAFLPDIQAKAHWYLGWIYTTLDGQPEKGQAHFHTIVQNFSQVPMNLSPPTPWANLVYSHPPSRAESVTQKTLIKYWSQIALLEIVRHGTRDEAVTAFDTLYDKFFTSTETGLALKTMLSNEKLALHARPLVEKYLARFTANPYLARDILRLAKGNIP